MSDLVISSPQDTCVEVSRVSRPTQVVMAPDTCHLEEADSCVRMVVFGHTHDEVSKLLVIYDLTLGQGYNRRGVTDD